MKLIKVPSCTFSKCPLVHECHRCKKNLTENRQLFSPLRVGNQGFYTTISDQSLNWLLGPMAPAPWDASSPNAMLHVLSAAEDSTDTEKGADWDVESGQNKQSGMRYHIYIYMYFCIYIYMIILGYNQITLHNLKQDYLNLEPPAVLYISISAGHVFMVIWRGRLEGLLNSDQPWFNPLAWGRGKTTGTSQCNSLGIKFHKLIHVPVYNPFFLRGKWRCFSHWSSEKKQDLASGHQTPEQGYSSQRLRLEVWGLVWASTPSCFGCDLEKDVDLYGAKPPEMEGSATNSWGFNHQEMAVSINWRSVTMLNDG